MTLHYLNPDDEPRLCECKSEAAVTRAIRMKQGEKCPYGCSGTGRLGNPAGPRVETWRGVLSGKWYAIVSGEIVARNQPTEASVLKAAREMNR